MDPTHLEQRNSTVRHRCHFAFVVKEQLFLPEPDLQLLIHWKHQRRQQIHERFVNAVVYEMSHVPEPKNVEFEFSCINRKKFNFFSDQNTLNFGPGKSLLAM